MDEIDILTQTLNSVIQRNIKLIHAYEIEITNMTAEIIRLQKRISKTEEVDIPEDSKIIKK